MRLYELYQNHINELQVPAGTVFITPADEYFEDNTKSGFVLDRYAVDGYEVFDTFEQAFNEAMRDERFRTALGELCSSI